MDESIKDITASIIKQLNDSIQNTSLSSNNTQLSLTNMNNLNQSSNVLNNNSTALATNSNTAPSIAGNNLVADSNNEMKQKQTILTINTV